LAAQEEAAPTRQPAAPDGALSLLGQEGLRGVLHALAQGPRSRAQLSRALGVSERTIATRLRLLQERGALTGAASGGRNGCRLFLLAPAGRQALAIDAELSRAYGRMVAEGIDAAGLQTLAQGGVQARRLGRALLERPATFSELAARLPEIPRSTLSRTLALMVRSGLVRREGTGRRNARYSPAPQLHHLARAAVMLAAWRWRHRPGQALALQGDLHGLLCLLASRLRPPAGLVGLCRLSQPPAGGRSWPDVLVALGGGRAQVVSVAFAPAREAHLHGTGLAWCQALLEGAGPLTIEGDRELARGLLGALAAALQPQPGADVD